MRLSSVVSCLSVVILVSSVACKKKDEDGAGAAASASAAASAAPKASASAAAAPSASAAPEDPNACPANNKAPDFKYSEVAFTWTEKPTLAMAPKDKAYANVGGKTFELPKVELWYTEKSGEWSLRTNDGVLLGPSLSMKGEPKAGSTYEDKMGNNRGYFQVPQKGTTAECHRQTTSYNGDNARIVKITKYDGKTVDLSFVTTWKARDDRKFWAAGTVKDARVVVFKK